MFAELGLVRWTQTGLIPESIRSGQVEESSHVHQAVELLQAGQDHRPLCDGRAWFNFVELNSKLAIYLT